MTRLTAILVAGAALLNASAALAQRGPPFSITPRADEASSQVAPTPIQAQATMSDARADPISPAVAKPHVFLGSIWTDPGGRFSFEKPRSWKDEDVETASTPGAARLDIVAGDDNGQCWFNRVPRERTATLTARQLVDARAKPIGADLWSRIAIDQQLLVGVAQVLESGVEYHGVWPVQFARLQGRNGEVYAAIHSRPGVDILAFCASKDQRDRSEVLNIIARSVTTPYDRHWQAQLGN